VNIVIKKVVLAATFVITYGTLVTAPAAANLLALQVGMDAPEFSLKNLGGEQKSFAELKGEKLTVLVFWSTWSKKSEKALARMQKLFTTYGAQGLAILGINVDEQQISDNTLAEIRRLQEKLKISYPMLVDHGLETFHDFGVIALPTTVILDKDRLIKYELSGYPLVGSETMADFITATIEGKKPEIATEKTGYQPNKQAIRLFNMGRTTLKSKRMADKAEMWFKKAAEADPNFILPHLSLGKIYSANGETALARAEYKEVLDRQPTNPIALCESGLLLVNEGKTGEGAALFDAARKTEESYAPCFYYAGYAYGKEGKLDEAMKLFAEAEKVNPTDYNIYKYKGRVLEEQKSLQKAAEAYRTALEKILAIKPSAP
jgi:peroxiredoxin/Tfp pilus assembly protein PilF